MVGHTNWVRTARFSPDSRLAVSGGDDKSVRIWDVGRSESIGTYNDMEGGINSTAFHPDGTCVAAGSADRTVKLWDLRSQALLQHYPAHADSVTNISFHESGNYLLSSGIEGALKIWDLREGQLLYTLHGHQGACTASAFAPTGSFFASGGVDKMVMVWKSSLNNIVGSSAPTESISVSATKPRVASQTQPLSYYSPKRGGSRSQVDTSTSLNTSAYSMRAQASASNHPPAPPSQLKSSPLRRGNQAPANPLGQLRPPSSVSGTGKEFVLEEFTSEDAQESCEPTEFQGNADSQIKLNKDQLPEVLAGALDHIVGQLDMVTRTLSILDKRLSLQEDLMAKHVFNSSSDEGGNKEDEPQM